MIKDSLIKEFESNYKQQEAQKGIMVACPLNWEASVSSK